MKAMDKLLDIHIKAVHLREQNQRQQIELARLEAIIIKMGGWFCARCGCVQGKDELAHGTDHDCCKHCVIDDSSLSPNSRYIFEDEDQL